MVKEKTSTSGCYICEGEFRKKVRKSFPPFMNFPESSKYMYALSKGDGKVSLSSVGDPNVPLGTHPMQANLRIFAVVIDNEKVCLECFDILFAFGNNFVERVIEHPKETNETIKMINCIRGEKKLLKEATKTIQKNQYFSQKFIENVKKKI